MMWSIFLFIIFLYVSIVYMYAVRTCIPPPLMTVLEVHWKKLNNKKCLPWSIPVQRVNQPAEQQTVTVLDLNPTYCKSLPKLHAPWMNDVVVNIDRVFYCAYTLAMWTCFIHILSYIDRVSWEMQAKSLRYRPHRMERPRKLIDSTVSANTDFILIPCWLPFKQGNRIV